MSWTGFVDSRLTPYTRDYETCESTHACLRIYPRTETIADVTGTLGVEPTEACDKGETIGPNSIGRTRTVKRTVWFLSSEKFVKSNDLRHHLDWVLEKIATRERAIRQIQEWDGVKMTLGCSWWSAHGHGGPVVWPEQMEIMARLNLEWSFEVMFFGDNIL